MDAKGARAARAAHQVGAGADEATISAAHQRLAGGAGHGHLRGGAPVQRRIKGEVAAPMHCAPIAATSVCQCFISVLYSAATNLGGGGSAQAGGLHGAGGKRHCDCWKDTKVKWLRAGARGVACRRGRGRPNSPRGCIWMASETREFFCHIRRCNPHSLLLHAWSLHLKSQFVAATGTTTALSWHHHCLAFRAQPPPQPIHSGRVPPT